MTTGRIIPGNPQRRQEAAKEDRHNEPPSGAAGFPLTWAGKAKDRDWPSSCEACGRKKRWMRQLQFGEAECAHVDCPHRHRLTAAGGDYYDGDRK